MDAQTLRYLRLVHEDALAEHDLWLNIFTLPDKSSACFQGPEAAAEHVAALAGERNVFCCQGLSDKPAPPGRRFREDDVVAVCGFWGDIDCGTEGHKRENLPPTIDDGRRIVSRLTIPSSVNVLSGHGLHPYWLFTEPWLIRDREERLKLKTLSRRWHATLQAIAHEMGWAYDMGASDLARVLRIPGTHNRKCDPPKLVILEAPDGEPRRYDLEQDLEPTMVAESIVAGSGTRPAAAVGYLVLSPGAEPPGQKLAAALTNHTRFKRTWERARPDLPDGTASGYDMALANVAAQCGWTDQEIANLLIAHRRKHGDDPKLRQDYYQLTIAKARAASHREQAVVELQDDNKLGVEGEPPISDSKRKAIVEAVSKAIELDVARYIKQGEENANFSLVLGNGTEIYIGDATTVMQQSRFAARIYDVLGYAIPTLKREAWRTVCNRLGQIAEVAANIETTRVGRLRGWLARYVAVEHFYSEENWQKAVSSRLPFMRDGRIFVSAGELRKFVKVELSENVSISSIYDMLRAAGFETALVQTRSGDRIASTRYWAGPANVLGEQERDFSMEQEHELSEGS